MLPRIGLIALLAVCANAATVADVRKGFERPPDDSRIMMRWWWFGSAVTKPELEREMRRMKEGGIGGFEVQPGYPGAWGGAAGARWREAPCERGRPRRLRSAASVAGRIG